MKIVTYGSVFQRHKPKEIEYSSFRDKVKVVYSENGNREFVKVGTSDIYELAQSHKESCSIENIIRRATNDPSVLRRTVGAYVNLTEVPENMFDAMKVVNDAKEVFKNLPSDQQSAYNNSFDSFLGSFRTATGLAKFITMNKKVDNVDVKEVDN